MQLLNCSARDFSLVPSRLVFRDGPEKPSALPEEGAREARENLKKAVEAERERSIARFHLQYDSLPANAFMIGAKPKWETVAAKLTPDVLAKANRLQNPRIYGINNKRELLIGDGLSEVPPFTYRQNYQQARSIAQAQGLSLMTKDEYIFFNRGTMEARNTCTWIESGEAPTLAWDGDWRGYVFVDRGHPDRSGDRWGARRVLRVKL